MERWKMLAIFAMFFAGLTSILAKAGMKHIGPDLGLLVRTVVVFVLVLGNVIITGQIRQANMLTRQNLLYLGISGVSTALAWILYYRAIKVGSVAFVSLIDKFSIVITLSLSVIFLNEPITPRFIIGAIVMLTGLVILVFR